jgi:toxin FitB
LTASGRERPVSSGRSILDTSVVIGPPIDPIPGAIAISAVTLAELHFGVLVAKTSEVRAERLRRLSTIQRHFDALPIDDAVATSYGQLAAAVVESGRQPRRRTMDLLIAATAHAHGATLYTRNVDDFLGLEKVIDLVAVP